MENNEILSKNEWVRSSEEKSAPRTTRYSVHFILRAAADKESTPIYFQHRHTLLRPCSSQHSFGRFISTERGKLFERANFNQQSDEPKSSSMNISQCTPTRQKEGKKEKAPKVHFSFLPTGSVRRRRCSKTARRAAISRMKNSLCWLAALKMGSSRSHKYIGSKIRGNKSDGAAHTLCDS